jgi:hypothetical protein
MPIPSLGKLITDCWIRAEQALRESIKQKFPDRDEEIITDHFHTELESELNRVSENGTVAWSFLSDLKASCPKLSEGELTSKVARRLMATVNFHPRHVEQRTAGDLCIVVIRPDVQAREYDPSSTAIQKDYRRGLLCQAKVFRRDSKWGSLSPAQQEQLPGKLGYFAVLLYRYIDQQGDRRNLGPFQWQLAADATLSDLEKWLASDKFPSLKESEQILRALVQDKIGTDDDEIIKRDIAPPLRPSLVIKIGWKDDDDPGKEVRVHQKAAAAHVQRQLQHH